MSGAGDGAAAREAIVAAFAWEPIWRMDLTRLVDGESTYTLWFGGDEPQEFSDTEDLYIYVAKRKAEVRADRVLGARGLPPPPTAEGGEG